MKANSPQAATIKAADIAELASWSRERALAARHAATELSAAQAAAVGGGGTFYARPFPWGVLPFLKMTDILTSPVDRMTVPTDIARGGGF